MTSAVALLSSMRRTLRRLPIPRPPGPVTCSIGLVEVLPDCYYGDYEIQEASNRAKNYAKAQGKDAIASFRDLAWLDSELAIFPTSDETS